MDSFAARPYQEFMRESFGNYADLLRNHAEHRGGKNALVQGDACVSYAELERRVVSFAHLLRTDGVLPGERIVIALPDCLDFICAFLGAMRHGALPVLLGPDMSTEEYAHVFADVSPRVLVTVGLSTAATAGSALRVLRVEGQEYARLLEGVAGSDSAAGPPFQRQDGPDFLLYTSGSTGLPKGVPHTQGDMLFCAEHYAGQVLGMREEDVVLSASKLHFAYGLGNSLIFPLYFGATAILNPEPPGPSGMFTLLGLLRKHRPTLFFAVPTLYNLMAKTLGEQNPFASVRLCVSAGEALPAGIFKQWRQATGLEILDGIGSTEALHIFLSNRPGEAAPGVVGRPVPGYEARLVTEDGLPAQPGTPGLLHIRGGSTAACYWNRPERTAQTMLPGGWLNTRDYFVEEGGYAYQGRADEMFKYGGGWVSPVRVEEALREHPAVSECAVTPCKVDGLLAPLAHIVPVPGFADSPGLALSLRNFATEHLPPPLRPVRFVFREALPKTRTGKINRSLIAQEE